ncbi:MAG: sigma-70 family RNA polymerase sigma factor [Planctomycetota bacterium]
MRPRSSPQAGGDGDSAVDLLARFRDGDRAAFDAIVVDFQERLIQFFYRLSWDMARAEDLTQTLFMKLLRGASGYRPEGKLATYLFRVATNLWIDHYRSMRPHARVFSLDQALLDGFEPSARVEAPADRMENAENRERLRDSLERLSEPHRLVFELAVYQELPYAEIGTILDIPVGTVKSRMHNAVKALRDLLAERVEDRADSFRAHDPRRGIA